MIRTGIVTVWLSLVMAHSAMAAEPVLLHAAGSLRGALTEVIAAFEAQSGLKVQAKYGASGLLKDEIAGGAKSDVFASANMEHPQALAQAHRSGPVVLFARNRMCVLARGGIAVDSATVLERMLDPALKLGTSTPLNDPSGDYAWEVFHKADTLRPDAFATLDKKALKLVGGATPPPTPANRSPYGELVASGAADLFLTYCTGAVAARQENPGQKVVALPDALATSADYGLTVTTDAPPDGYRLAMFILSPEGQRILARFGFAAPTLPQ